MNVVTEKTMIVMTKTLTLITWAQALCSLQKPWGNIFFFTKNPILGFFYSLPFASRWGQLTIHRDGLWTEKSWYLKKGLLVV